MTTRNAPRPRRFAAALALAACVAVFVVFAAGVPAQETSRDDGEIVAIVAASNETGLEAARLAQARAKDVEVKAFADRSARQHRGMRVSLLDLERDLQIAPADSPTSRRLRAAGEQTLQRLARLHGRAFDEAYLAAEETRQRRLFALLEALIPHASESELQVLPVKLRPVVDAYVEQAAELRGAFDGEARAG